MFIFALTLHPAFAQTPQGMPAGIVAQVESLSTGWQTRAFNIANNLFLVVALTSIVIAAARYAITERTLHGFQHCFLEQLGLLAVPWALLKTASTLIPQLITDMTSTAQTVAGATTTMPLDIFKQGLAIAAALIGGAVKGGIMTMIPGPLQGLAGQLLGIPPSPAQINGVTNMIDNGINTAVSLNPEVSSSMAEGILYMGLFAALFIVVCFTLVATELLLAFVQTYMTASIGAINLGWGAARGTSSWASAYYGALMNSFMRLTVIYAVVVIGQSIAAGWVSELASTRPATLIATLLEICGSSLMYAVIVKRIGSIASNLLSGRPAMGANDATGVMDDFIRRFKK